MKQLITLIAASLLFTGNAVASGVWAPQSSSGGSGGGGRECYLVTFNAGTYGTRMLMGNGIVSGSFYKGFLLGAPNPYNGRVVDCGTDGQCAWNSADYIGYGGYASVVVSGLPILSAQAVACF